MLDQNILLELQAYIESHRSYNIASFIGGALASKNYALVYESIKQYELEDFIETTRKPALNQVLFSLIDEKGVSDSDIYKRAGIDRRHFSKIRSSSDYRPSKNTVIALAIALELNKNNADTLLSAAGYSLSDSDTFDLVIQFCLEKKIYDIHDINRALDYFSLKPLGVLE